MLRTECALGLNVPPFLSRGFPRGVKSSPPPPSFLFTEPFSPNLLIRALRERVNSRARDTSRELTRNFAVHLPSARHEISKFGRIKFSNLSGGRGRRGRVESRDETRDVITARARARARVIPVRRLSVSGNRALTYVTPSPRPSGADLKFKVPPLSSTRRMKRTEDAPRSNARILSVRNKKRDYLFSLSFSISSSSVFLPPPPPITSPPLVLDSFMSYRSACSVR